MRIENIKHRICCKCAGFMDSWPVFDITYPYLKCRICGFCKENKIMFITEETFLMGRAKKEELAPELQTNMNNFLVAINELLDIYGKTPTVTSGYRTAAANSAAGGAKLSSHMQCLAVDLSDNDGELWHWISNNFDILQRLGLFCEHPNWTHTLDGKGSWVHIQLKKPGSGKRVYVPNSNPPTNPNFWSGKYDSKYDIK